MMLGKRARPSMRRTTSLTEFTLDLSPEAQVVDVVQVPPQSDVVVAPEPYLTRRNTVGGGATGNGTGTGTGGEGVGYGLDDQRFMSSSMVSPRRKSVEDIVDTPHFLRTCGLCKRSLRPGRDIYMYRGDTAFCSLECRQQQMNHDERKEKCSITSSKKDHHASSTATGSEPSNKGGGGETIAAA